MYRVYLVAGSTSGASSELIQDIASGADSVIAVDGGADWLYKADVLPDMFVGDKDSVSDKVVNLMKKHNVEADIYPVDKDYTDLALAFNKARELIVEAQDEEFEVVLSCVSGGAQDHNLAALGTIAHNSDLKCVIEEDDFTAFILSEDGVEAAEFDDAFVGTKLSCIALKPNSCVSEEGMKWELDHKDLEVLGDLGMSNVITSDESRLICHSGCVAVFVN